MTNENVIALSDFLSRAGWKRKKNTECQHAQFELDESETRVYCGKCGDPIEAFRALKLLAVEFERIDHAVARLRAEIEELSAWNPWLRAVRELERIWRGNMRPCCPHCGKTVEAEALAKSRRFVGKRPEREKE